MNTPRVILDKLGSSPSPQQSIWRGQHICVSEDSTQATVPSEAECGRIVIDNQLKFGHWSVLDQAYVRFETLGFEHSVMTQLTRHHELYPLVCSGRYSGKRFSDVAYGDLEVDDAFYFRVPGEYRDRKGHKYIYTLTQLEQDRIDCFNACLKYEQRMSEGFSEEHARSCIPYNFRQDFCFAGTLRKIFHMLDQRGNKDSQLEIQELATQVMDCLLVYCPEIAFWYCENRFTKARLAP